MDVDEIPALDFPRQILERTPDARVCRFVIDENRDVLGRHTERVLKYVCHELDVVLGPIERVEPTFFIARDADQQGVFRF